MPPLTVTVDRRRGAGNHLGWMQGLPCGSATPRTSTEPTSTRWILTPL